MSMPDTAQWVAIAVAALTGGFARDIFAWLRGLFKGAGHRRSELDRAWEKADDESRKRRIAEEHASQIRRLLIEAQCVENDTIPPFPTYPKKES